MVFFRKQDDITNDLQKELVQRLGELSGKPSTSKLHIHPVSNSGRELGGKDDEISVISSEQAKKIYKGKIFFQTEKKQSGKEGWHSDITFEPVPSDYALLRLTQLPKTGGGKRIPHIFCFALTDMNRHPLGIRLRSLRPHLNPHPKIPRIPNSNLRPTKIQRSRREKRLQDLFRTSRRPRKCRRSPRSHPPRRAHQPRHRLEEHFCSRPSRAENQWTD